MKIIMWNERTGFKPRVMIDGPVFDAERVFIIDASDRNRVVVLHDERSGFSMEMDQAEFEMVKKAMNKE